MSGGVDVLRTEENSMVSAGSISTPRGRGEKPGHDQERRHASGSTRDFARVVAGPGAHSGDGWDGSSGGSRSQEGALEDRSTQARSTQARGTQTRSIEEGRGEGRSGQERAREGCGSPPS